MQENMSSYSNVKVSFSCVEAKRDDFACSLCRKESSFELGEISLYNASTRKRRFEDCDLGSNVGPNSILCIDLKFTGGVQFVYNPGSQQIFSKTDVNGAPYYIISVPLTIKPTPAAVPITQP